MTPHEFKAKWSQSAGSERQTYQEHFRDLCDLLGQPRPSAANRADLDYTFEKPVAKAGGGQGFADVWRRGFFGWEYKSREADLAGAHVQLLGYMNALENPPLLVVSTPQLIRIFPTFQNRKIDPIDVRVADLDEDAIETLRRIFNDPGWFGRPKGSEKVTRAAAEAFGKIAGSLHARGEDPQRVAHFLVQLLFCLFAEDTAILPKGLFGRLLAFGAKTPAEFALAADELLRAMGTGGYFWGEEIPHVNGGLFREVDVVTLEQPELAVLAGAATLDWGRIEPAIFGTLFERSLDPASRAQLGAHYTGRADIERVVEPVVMVPLRRRWAEVRAEADLLLATWRAAPRGRRADAARDAFARRLNDFRAELRAVRILDPACGSGNFLYVALDKLLGLENEVIWHGVQGGLSGQFPEVSTDQLLGLEVNAYARELAQVVVWIGYLQWRYTHGFGHPVPVLAPLETIELRDALLDRTDPDHPKEAAWPPADFIIGNPPFLGGNRVRGELGDAYLDDLFKVYAGRVPAFADLVTYFFEKARSQIEAGETKRSGLLATNAIRGGANREVLRRIKQSGDIFTAWDNEPWVLEGASVRISIIAFDNGSESERLLNGLPTTAINADLTGTLDLSSAANLVENRRLCFQGPSAKAPFDIAGDVAREMLRAPLNVNRRPNSDVVRPVVSAVDIARGSRNMWTIDFALMSESEASYYELPFEHVVRTVLPVRKTRRDDYGGRWWQYARPRPELRRAVADLARQLVTPAHAKHRLFAWYPTSSVCNQGTLVFAREDDYFFGVLQSRAHEVWSLRMGTWLGVGNDPRYTPTTCFETFPLPWPPGHEPAPSSSPLLRSGRGAGGEGDPAAHGPATAHRAIAAAAADLDRLRTAWLNPDGATEAELKKRTLTNLYNQRPTWLANAHAALDRAVWVAYAWDDDPAATTDEDILTRLLALNLERSTPAPTPA